MTTSKGPRFSSVTSPTSKDTPDLVQTFNLGLRYKRAQIYQRTINDLEFSIRGYRAEGSLRVRIYKSAERKLRALSTGIFQGRGICYKLIALVEIKVLNRLQENSLEFEHSWGQEKIKYIRFLDVGRIGASIFSSCWHVFELVPNLTNCWSFRFCHLA